jgi:hypothetical protein
MVNAIVAPPKSCDAKYAASAGYGQIALSNSANRAPPLASCGFKCGMCGLCRQLRSR